MNEYRFSPRPPTLLDGPLSFVGAIDTASVKLNRFADVEFKFIIPREFNHFFHEVQSALGIPIKVTIEPWKNELVQ